MTPPDHSRPEGKKNTPFISIYCPVKSQNWQFTFFFYCLQKGLTQPTLGDYSHVVKGRVVALREG